MGEVMKTGILWIVRLVLIVVFIGVSTLWAQQRASERRVADPGGTQFDVQFLRPSGGPVIPIFEGWYQHLDGSYELSFGYFNVNTEELLEIPLGPDNFIEPKKFDGVQPTTFLPMPAGDRRHWGVFTVPVSADFGNQDVVWTLRIHGQELSVPGRVTSPPYQLNGWIVPGEGTASPLLRFDPDGRAGRGPWGLRTGPVMARVGQAIQLNAWTGRDEKFKSDTRPIHIKWFKHQGPGDVHFSNTEVEIRAELWTESTTGTLIDTNAVFSEPGKYVVRVLAFNTIREFEFQCCWTNGYIDVIVVK